MFITSLQGVDNTEDLSSVTTGRSRVRQNKANCFLRVNDKDGADCESNPLGVDVGSVLVVDPISGQFLDSKKLAYI